MSSIYITQGIILTRKPYRESGSLNRCLAEELGVISIITQGSSKEKSKFTGMLEPFNLLMMELYRSPKSEIYTLRNASLQKNYLQGLNYEKTMLLNAATELIMQVDFSCDDNNCFFELLNIYCNYMHTSKYHPYLVFVRFAMRLFHILGIPLNTICTSCRKSELSCYTVFNHGFLCHHCSPLSTAAKPQKSNSVSYLNVAETTAEYRSEGNVIKLSGETAAVIQKLYLMDTVNDSLVTCSLVEETVKIIIIHLNSLFHKSFHLNSLKDYCKFGIAIPLTDK